MHDLAVKKELLALAKESFPKRAAVMSDSGEVIAQAMFPDNMQSIEIAESFNILGNPITTRTYNLSRAPEHIELSWSKLQVFAYTPSKSIWCTPRIKLDQGYESAAALDQQHQIIGIAHWVKGRNSIRVAKGKKIIPCRLSRKSQDIFVATHVVNTMSPADRSLTLWKFDFDD